MKFKFTILAAMLMFMTSGVQANTISTVLDVTSTDPGTVQYVNFDVTTAGSFTIEALGEPTYGSTFSPDPEILLFSSPLNQLNLVAEGSDSAGNFESFISDTSLNVGSYILAVSGWEFSIDDALSGSNSDITDFGKVHVNILSEFGNAQLTTVPVPGAVWLLGSGLLGLFGMRKKLNVKDV